MGRLFREVMAIVRITFGVLLRNIKKIDVNIRNCGRGGRRCRFMEFFLRLTAVLRSTLRLRHARSSSVYARRYCEQKGNEGIVTLSPLSSVLPPKILSSLLSKFCKNVPRARIKRVPPYVVSPRPRFECRNFGATHSAIKLR